MSHWVLTHEDHGKHHCYDRTELDYLTKQRGWKVEKEVKPDDGKPKPQPKAK